MRKFLYLFFCSYWILGCSQDPKLASVPQKTEAKRMYDINQFIIPEAKDINEQNFASKITGQIQRYDREPSYYFRINKQNALIRIYINDVNIYSDHKLSNIITPIPIDHILKSGNQKVTVKMYPVGNLLNESWGKTDGQPITELSENSEVSIEVICIDEKSPKGLNDEKEITKITSPKEAAGKNYYEFSFTFNADVPYQFEGWTKGQDLTKLDQNLVRKKALEFYKMVGEIYVNKDLNSRLKLDYPSTLRIMASAYVNEQYMNDVVKEYKKYFQNNDYVMKPLIDFGEEFMGNGKLLRLVETSRSLDARGGALILKYGNKGIYRPAITLYLPEGRDLATQGFMMWK